MITPKRKPVVGETLYSLNIGNAYNPRYNAQELTPMLVTGVRRKYFTVETPGRIEVEFHLDTWAENIDFTSSHRLFESPQEWEDEKEGDEAADFIWRFFQYGKPKNLTLDQLRQIKAIIDQPRAH